MMKEQGYKGKMTVLNMHMKSIRNEVKSNTHYLKRSKLKKLFFYGLENIKNESNKMPQKFNNATNSANGLLNKVKNIALMK